MTLQGPAPAHDPGPSIERSKRSILYPVTKKRLVAKLVVICRIAIGTVFLVAGTSKVQYPYDFLESVFKYRIAGPGLSQVIAQWLPWIEIAVGICYVGNVLSRGTYLVSGFLGVCFLAVKAWAVHRDTPVGCGCVATGTTQVLGITDLGISALLLASIAAAWIYEERNWRCMATTDREHRFDSM